MAAGLLSDFMLVKDLLQYYTNSHLNLKNSNKSKQAAVFKVTFGQRLFGLTTHRIIVTAIQPQYV